jgi:hypothetical protein
MGPKRLVRILPLMDSEKFEHYLAQNLEPLETAKHVGFRTGLQTGSFPSAGKALMVTSHTSPTSSMCTTQNLNWHCFWYNSSDQMDWCNTLMFSSQWLSGAQVLVNFCQRKEVSYKRLQSKHCPSLGVSVYHKFSLKSTVHNRGPILVATQVVKFNGYFRGSDNYPGDTGQGILQGSCQHETTFYRMGSAKEGGQLSSHLPILPKI